MNAIKSGILAKTGMNVQKECVLQKAGIRIYQITKKKSLKDLKTCLLSSAILLSEAPHVNFPL